MKSLSRENQADIIEAFNSTSGHLDDLLYIDIYFEHMVDRIWYAQLNFSRIHSSDTEAPFLDVNLSITNGTVSTKIYDKRNDFDFDIINFPFLDGDVPRRTSYGVYISQLIRFARASSSIVTSTVVTKPLQSSSLGNATVIINFAKHFQSFIVVTVGW